MTFYELAMKTEENIQKFRVSTIKTVNQKIDKHREYKNKFKLKVLSPQVTARRVGPPPTAVSTVKQPPSPMQEDPQPPKRIPWVPLSYRAKDFLQFLGKGNRQGKVFAVSGSATDIFVQYNRSNGRSPTLRQVLSPHREKLCTEGA